MNAEFSGPLHSSSLAALQAKVGTTLGASEWVAIDQPMIDGFAAVTRDRYFAHVDPERAAQGPFGRTIAHGFLTLSLIASMAYEVCPAIEGSEATLNYGFDRMRFVAPVRSDQRVRAHFTLHALEQSAPDRVKLAYDVSVEIEGQTKPALTGLWVQVVLLPAA